MYDDFIDLQEKLTAWGHWVLADGTGLGYKSPMALVMRGRVAERRKPRFRMFISDDDALIIERYITTLCERKPLEGKILRLKYVERMSDRAIAREYLTPLKYGADSDKKVGSNQAANLVARAEGFILGLMMNDSYQ